MGNLSLFTARNSSAISKLEIFLPVCLHLYLSQAWDFSPLTCHMKSSFLILCRKQDILLLASICRAINEESKCLFDAPTCR